MITPISYYGGKLRLVPELLPLIPPHFQYVEPFCGGASLFWAKKPSGHEVLNDSDMRVANFWWVLQNDFAGLQRLIRQTLHHEGAHREAKEILQAEIDDRTVYAWAFWIQTQLSFSRRLFGGFAFDNVNKSCLNTYHKTNAFKDLFHQRIKNTELFCRDALELIKLKDGEDVFMYFDPPYAESDCGHYNHTKGIYYELLDLLPSLKCKWLMSSYPSEQLNEIRLINGYYTKDAKMPLSVSGGENSGKFKTECLTWNYIQTHAQQSMF